MEWNGMEWNGMGWNGMEWNGMEWNVCILACKKHACIRYTLKDAHKSCMVHV